jgi:signal transduction histidine kinase
MESPPLCSSLITAGAAHGAVALLWAVVAWDIGSSLRNRPQRRALPFLGLVVAVSMTIAYAGGVPYGLVPPEIRAEKPTGLRILAVVRDVAVILGTSAFRHMVRYFPLEVREPSRGWLLVNYGSAALVAAFCIAICALAPAGSVMWRVVWIVFVAFVVTMLGLALLQIRRVARDGGWRPAGLGVARRSDVVVLGAALVVLSLLFVIMIVSDSPLAKERIVILDALVGFAFAIPFVMRSLGEVVRLYLLTVSMGVVVALAYVGGPALRARFETPWARMLVDVGAIAFVVVAIGHAHLWVRAGLERLLFRRSRRRRAELQGFVRTLAAELGVREATRLALAEAFRVLQLRGAAVILDDGSAPLCEGALAIGPVADVWPRGAGAAFLPARVYGAGSFEELPRPLALALVAADVTGVVPIVSPRRRWGDMFITTGPLGAFFGTADVEAVESFAAQLALVLDGAELLARARTVERSLAQAEKLAAVGETAASLAHEIRNPVTAARSLAQMLAREPGASDAPELATLILGELERVERRVAALLRFARPDEPAAEIVDVERLVHGTLAGLRGRLEAADVGVVCDVGPGIAVRGDGEQLRQVLVNLVENAVDAMAGAPAPRRLTVQASNGGSRVVLRVGDTGTGVAPDALPRVFEPFFSQKAQGTGLGLAIARRTIDAHGGRIALEPGAAGGTTVTVELPAAPRVVAA